MKNKTILLFALLLIGFTVKSSAQDFKPVLQESVITFFQAQDNAAKIVQSNKLIRIANKFDQEWAAAYYAALSQIMLTYTEQDKDKKDAYLDRADEWLDKATALSNKDDANQQSELLALRAMSANARIGVDPQKRWKKYGEIFENSLKAAKAQNEDNPRIYFLKGTSLFYTPKAFGGGKEKAAEYFEKAQALFQKENHDDILKPSWGAETNAYYLKECHNDKDNANTK